MSVGKSSGMNESHPDTAAQYRFIVSDNSY